MLKAYAQLAYKQEKSVGTEEGKETCNIMSMKKHQGMALLF